jgi:hypothetical protein
MAEYDFHFTAEVMDGIFGEVIEARGAWDSLNERLDNIEQGAGGDTYTKAEVDTMLAEKVDKVNGKGLSTNDFTDEDKEQITTNKNGIAELTAKEEQLENDISLLAMHMVYSSVRNTSTTHTYTMKASDFNNSQAGTYLITIVTWSTTPSFSLYAASYSGNQTTVTNLTKIAGADANISLTDGVISCTTSGKIQIIAVH